MFAAHKHQGHKSVDTGKFRPVSPGFSLIEVLIASTVFSLGLAGFTALLLTSIIGSAEARREGIASMAAASLAEQIHLNPTALDRYLNPPEYISRICTGNNSCTPEHQADYDFRLWQLELADSIKNARGLVCHDETPRDGIEGNSQCDGAGPLVIKIFWNGRNPGNEGMDNNKSTSHRFSLQIS
ncbi:MAG: type IV pilus modification protein PilV [Gammaproteobacteria bacterium]|nr:type IV pilus modification protein PilV [Gammaproteobacteria bacterium]